MINSYRRYLKELEILVSDKNRFLFNKIRDLDTVCCGENFLLDYDVNVMSTKSNIYAKDKIGKSDKKKGTKIQNYSTYSTHKKSSHEY